MSNSVQYAGFWMRFVAVIIDGIILQILQSIIIIPILGAIGFVDNSFAEILCPFPSTYPNQPPGRPGNEFVKRENATGSVIIPSTEY